MNGANDMSDAGHQLFRETEAAKTLLAQISDIIGDDDEAKADAVEGETDLLEAIDLAVQQLVDDMATIKGLNDYIEKLTARKERMQERVAHFRTALAAAMDQAGRKKVEHPAVTLSLRAVPQSVSVTDESAIPSRFFTQPEPPAPKLDKKALLEALKAKESIAGCTLSNGGTALQLRFD
jgi:hypothetical protein